MAAREGHFGNLVRKQQVLFIAILYSNIVKREEINLFLHPLIIGNSQLSFGMLFTYEYLMQIKVENFKPHLLCVIIE